MVGESDFPVGRRRGAEMMPGPWAWAGLRFQNPHPASPLGLRGTQNVSDAQHGGLSSCAVLLSFGGKPSWRDATECVDFNEVGVSSCTFVRPEPPWLSRGTY